MRYQELLAAMHEKRKSKALGKVQTAAKHQLGLNVSVSTHTCRLGVSVLHAYQEVKEEVREH